MYIIDRLKERDTQTVLIGALFGVAIQLFPAYAMAINVVAGVLGIGIAGTPLKHG